RAVPHLVDEIGLGDQLEGLQLAVEDRGGGEAGAGIEHQALLVDVGDVHRVGGRSPADAEVAAEDDAGDAGEGDPPGVHRRPAGAGGAARRLVGGGGGGERGGG